MVCIFGAEFNLTAFLLSSNLLLKFGTSQCDGKTIWSTFIGVCSEKKRLCWQEIIYHLNIYYEIMLLSSFLVAYYH